MPWSVDKPPAVAKNWSRAEREKCVSAANAVLRNGGSDVEAIRACIHAAGKSKKENAALAGPWTADNLPPIAGDLNHIQREKFACVANKVLHDGSTDTQAILMGVHAAERPDKDKFVAADDIQNAPRIIPVPFREAIEWARGRGVVLPDQYYNVLQGFARMQAFSVAGVAAIDQLQAILDSLTQALIDGDSFERWKGRVAAGIEDLGLPDYRLENIFRTNTQSHYNRGRCEQQTAVRDSRPFLLYDAVNDSRTRPAHAAMDGFVASYDDDIWKDWYPPNGYQCRCRVVALTEEQARRHLDAWSKKLEDQDAFQGFVDAVGQGPDHGWDYHPCQDAADVMRRLVERRQAALHPTLANALGDREEQRPEPEPHQFYDEDELALDTIKAHGAAVIEEILDFRLPDDRAQVPAIIDRGRSVRELAEDERTRPIDRALARNAPVVRKHILDKLKEVRSVGGEKIQTVQRSGRAREEMDRVGSLLPDSWVRKANEDGFPLFVRFSARGRGFFQRFRRETVNGVPRSGVRFIKTSGGSVSEHEYFHYLQIKFRKLDALFREEHERRTRADPIEDLYGPDEVGRKDRYVEKYQGREYDVGADGHGSPLEVITVGFQSLLGSDWQADVWLAKMFYEDPEMLHLMLGVLFHFRPAQ